jgi:hypothetical protein
LGAGVRSGTGSRIGSTTIFLSGFPISIGLPFLMRLCGIASLPPVGCQEARTFLEGRRTRPARGASCRR